MLCPEGNGRLNELGEFWLSAGGYVDYLFCKFIQFKTFINLKFFPFFFLKKKPIYLFIVCKFCVVNLFDESGQKSWVSPWGPQRTHDL